MPFRIKVSLSLILAFILLLLIGPFLLPVTPLKDTRPAAGLAGPDSSFTVSTGLNVHYVGMDGSTADGPQLRQPLVLLHGYLFNTDSFRDVQPQLAAAGPVVSFDRPGFGLTDRPTRANFGDGVNPYSTEGQVELTRGFLDSLGIDRAVLFGHSSGAVAAIDFALAHPERVAGLVLVAPAVTGNASAPAWLGPVLRSPQMNRVGPLLMRQLAGDPGGGFMSANWGNPDRIDDAAVRAFHRNFAVDDWDRGLWEVSRASSDPDFLDRLGTLSQPVLLLAGGLDTIVPALDTQQLSGHFPDATFRLLDDCGHVVHEECADEVSAMTLDWLAEKDLLTRPGGAR